MLYEGSLTSRDSSQGTQGTGRKYILSLTFPWLLWFGFLYQGPRFQDYLAIKVFLVC